MKLIVRSGAGEGTELEPTTDRLVMGRDETCDLVLDDDRASRQHAALERLPDGGYQVVDLGSTNGTFVNDARISAPVALTPGTEIRIGSTVIAVEGAPAGATVIEGAPTATVIGAPAAPGAEPGVAAPPPPPTPSRIVRLQRGMKRWKWAAIGLGVAALAGLGAALGLVFTGGSSTLEVVTQQVTAPAVTLVETVVVTEEAGSETVPEDTVPDDGSGEAPPDEGGEDDGEDGGVEPSPDEIALIAHIPDAIWSLGCWPPSAAALDIDGVVTGVGCGGENGSPEVMYRQFSSSEEMTREYDNIVDDFGIARDTGDCVADADAESSWNDESGTPSGRLLCAALDGAHLLLWTHDELAIFSTIIVDGETQEARQQAYDLWLEAGPQ